MGAGKTSAMINFINNAPEDRKFLYITPYLDEVERITNACKSKDFKQPKKYGTKLRGIKYLFEKGENIVSTHALFTLFDEEIIDLVYANNYTLIMDEVAEVVETYDISKYDLDTVLEKYAHIEDGHRIVWDATEYEGEFEKYRRLANLGCLGLYGNNIVIWMFPISTFKAFREIYLLTYLFDAQYQKYYYDYYGIEYNYLNVKKNDDGQYVLTNDLSDYDLPDYKSLINILDNEKLNEIGDLYYSLSQRWYERHKDDVLIKRLKNNCLNFFVHYARTPSALNMWTTFGKYESGLTGKGYAKGFTPCNLRATNDYRNKESAAYLINKFYDPYIKNFFVSNGIKVNEDLYALSELLQWLFRTRIREGKPINLYIPSKRMRELLIGWINEIDEKRRCIDH